MSKTQTLGDRVKRLRVDSGMTQTALAAAAGISLQTLRLIEQGVTATPQGETIKSLARVLNVRMAVLAGGKP